MPEWLTDTECSATSRVSRTRSGKRLFGLNCATSVNTPSRARLMSATTRFGRARSDVGVDMYSSARPSRSGSTQRWNSWGVREGMYVETSEGFDGSLRS